MPGELASGTVATTTKPHTSLRTTRVTRYSFHQLPQVLHLACRKGAGRPYGVLHGCIEPVPAVRRAHVASWLHGSLRAVQREGPAVSECMQGAMLWHRVVCYKLFDALRQQHGQLQWCCHSNTQHTCAQHASRGRSRAACSETKAARAQTLPP